MFSVSEEPTQVSSKDPSSQPTNPNPQPTNSSLNHKNGTVISSKQRPKRPGSKRKRTKNRKCRGTRGENEIIKKIAMYDDSPRSKRWICQRGERTRGMKSREIDRRRQSELRKGVRRRRRRLWRV